MLLPLRAAEAISLGYSRDATRFSFDLLDSTPAPRNPHYPTPVHSFYKKNGMTQDAPLWGLRSPSDMLTHTIKDCAHEVMKALGRGHSESVYHKSLITILNNRSIAHRTEVICPIMFMGECVGVGRADLIVDNIVVEIKAFASSQRTVSPQLRKYLCSMSQANPNKQFYGLILNFNTCTGQVESLEETYPPLKRESTIATPSRWKPTPTGIHPALAQIKREYENQLKSMQSNASANAKDVNTTNASAKDVNTTNASAKDVNTTNANASHAKPTLINVIPAGADLVEPDSNPEPVIVTSKFFDSIMHDRVVIKEEPEYTSHSAQLDTMAIDENGVIDIDSVIEPLRYTSRSCMDGRPSRQTRPPDYFKLH